MHTHTHTHTHTRTHIIHQLGGERKVGREKKGECWRKTGRKGGIESERGRERERERGGAGKERRR